MISRTQYIATILVLLFVVCGLISKRYSINHGQYASSQAAHPDPTSKQGLVYQLKSACPLLSESSQICTGGSFVCMHDTTTEQKTYCERHSLRNDPLLLRDICAGHMLDSFLETTRPFVCSEWVVSNDMCRFLKLDCIYRERAGSAPSSSTMLNRVTLPAWQTRRCTKGPNSSLSVWSGEAWLPTWRATWPTPSCTYRSIRLSETPRAGPSPCLPRRGGRLTGGMTTCCDETVGGVRFRYADKRVLRPKQN